MPKQLKKLEYIFKYNGYTTTISSDNPRDVRDLLQVLVNFYVLEDPNSVDYMRIKMRVNGELQKVAVECYLEEEVALLEEYGLHFELLDI